MRQTCRTPLIPGSLVRHHTFSMEKFFGDRTGLICWISPYRQDAPHSSPKQPRPNNKPLGRADFTVTGPVSKKFLRRFFQKAAAFFSSAITMMAFYFRTSRSLAMLCDPHGAHQSFTVSNAGTRDTPQGGGAPVSAALRCE